MLRYSIHEVGHLLALPREAQAHVSLKHPCELCSGDEGNEKSVSHVGYDPDYILPVQIDIVYSLAGGASQVACGLPTTMEQKGYGEFPEGMDNDLDNLREHCDLENGDLWTFLIPSLSVCFSEIVIHFKDVSRQIEELALRLREQGELTSKEVDLSFFDRDAMQSKVETILGM